MKEIMHSLWGTLKAVVNDRYAWEVMIGAVLLYSVFYPEAYRVQVARDLPMAVLDLDQSASSRDLIRRLDAVRAVAVTAGPLNMTQARSLLEDGAVSGFIVVPDGYERAQLRGQAGEVELYGNGVWLSRAVAVLAGMGEAVTSQAAHAALQRAGFAGLPSTMPVTVVQRPLYNTKEGYGSFVVPGVSELIVHQTVLLGIGVLLGGRREQLGRRLQMASSHLIGVAAAFGLITLAGTLYYAGFTAWVQDYPRGGNIPSLLVAAVAFSAATVAFGMWVGSFFDTRIRGLQFVTSVSVTLFFLSNLSWPAFTTPALLVALTHLLPTTSGINAIVQAQQMGAGVNEIGRDLFNLLLLTLGYGVLMWRRLALQH